MLCIALSSWLSTCLSTTQPSLFWPLIISSGHRFLGNYYFTCRFSIAFQVIFFEKPWSSIFRISFCTINDFNACFSCSNYLLVTDFNDFFSSYRRVTGLIITHQRAALFTARRQEMIEVLERTFFYLLTHPVVHSLHSEIPFQVGWYFLYVNHSLHLVDGGCQRVRSQGTENRDWDMFDRVGIVTIPLL